MKQNLSDDVRQELNLDIDWRITEEGYNVIRKTLRELRATNILEFGSGASTIRIAREFPSLQITTVEHDKRFCESTLQLAATFGVSDQIKLMHCPLRNIWIKGRRFLTYQEPKFAGIFDFILIDGPPGQTRRGREACLYFSYGHLRVGGVVILDDIKRLSEQRILKNWMSIYGKSVSLAVFDSGNGLAVLRKTNDNRKKQVSIRCLLDNYAVLLCGSRFNYRA